MDIPGEALSCVVITRIPFAVPSDPIVAARSETFDDSFTQYSIPEAILMFRQGSWPSDSDQRRSRGGRYF